jgi:hypothetical protein
LKSCAKSRCSTTPIQSVNRISCSSLAPGRRVEPEPRSAGVNCRARPAPDGICGRQTCHTHRPRESRTPKAARRTHFHSRHPRGTAPSNWPSVPGSKLRRSRGIR